MKIYNVKLNEEYPFLKGGNLECILTDRLYDDPNYQWKRPALIIVPGGGYAMVSKREGGPIANAFLAKGFQCFVLTYLCCKENAYYPEQFLELSAAVDYVRKNAEKFNVNPNEIFAVGFSAGGHLTANLAVHYAEASSLARHPLDGKPRAVGLSYAVITRGEGHIGSHDNLLGSYNGEEKKTLLEHLNLDKHVTEATAPAFIWTTATDTVVPATNSLVFATALARHNVPYELHIFPEGEHGLSTGDCEVNPSCKPELKDVRGWVSDCARFFRRFTEEKF